MADSSLNVAALEALRLIECPICFEVIGPPIFQCSNGHLVCSACLDKITHCPTCRAVMPYPRIRNLVVENLVAQKCPNSKFGCQMTVTSKDKTTHLQHCEYRQASSSQAMGFCAPVQSIQPNFSYPTSNDPTSIAYERQAPYNESWVEESTSTNTATPNNYFQRFLGKYEFVSSDDPEYTPVGYRNSTIVFTQNSYGELSRKSSGNSQNVEFKFAFGEKFDCIIDSDITTVTINMVGDKLVHTLQYTEEGESFQETVVEEFRGNEMKSTYTFEEDVHNSMYRKVG